MYDYKVCVLVRCRDGGSSSSVEVVLDVSVFVRCRRCHRVDAAAAFLLLRVLLSCAAAITILCILYIAIDFTHEMPQL